MDDNTPPNVPAPDQKPLPPEAGGFSKEFMMITALAVVALGLILFKMTAKHGAEAAHTSGQQAYIILVSGEIKSNYCTEDYIKQIVRTHPKYPSTVADCNALYDKIVSTCFDKVRPQFSDEITEDNKEKFTGMMTDCIFTKTQEYK